MAPARPPTTAIVGSVVFASIVLTAFHFTDNYVSIDTYPQPGWVTKAVVLVSWPLLTSLGLVTLLVFIAACGGGAESQHAEKEPAAEETQATAENSQVASEEARNTGADLENPSLGDENAPVVMIEYADYQ